MRTVLAAALCALSALVTTDCVPSNAGSPPSRLRVGLYSDVQSLDPHLKHEALTLSILANVYEGLTSLDSEARVRPALAESWETIDDLTWRLHLRPGAHFHDGRELTAEDVVFSLERARRNPRSQLGHYLVAVSSVRALDRQTVDVRTAEPFAILLLKLAMVMIVPAGSPEEIREPVGTGPYRLARHVPGQRLELHRFDGYWGPRPAYADVDLAVVSKPEDRVAALVAGQLDLALEIPPTLIAAIEHAPHCHVASRRGLTMVMLSGRLDRPPFSDLRVRQAIALAVDRDALVRDELLGHGLPASQPIGGDVFGYDRHISIPRRDLPAAHRLLEEAGYGAGIDLDLEFRTGRRIQGLESQLAEAGIRVRPREEPWSVLFQRLTAGESAFYMIGFSAVGADASTLLDSWLHSPDARRAYGVSNFNRYRNRELDDLIERSARSFSVEQRRDLLETSISRAMADLPLVPLFALDDLYGVRDDLDWQPRLDGRFLAAGVARQEPREVPREVPADSE